VADALRAFQADVVPVIELEWVEPEDHRAAVQVVLAADRRHLSLVDCTSFQLMRRLGVRSAFAFDPHFAEQGFDLRPQGQPRLAEGKRRERPARA
jgi:predicted nucleic acid-binding protein